MIPKSISPTDLRKELYDVVHEVASKGQRYLITPSHGESVVLCSRAEYNSLIAERQLLRDLREAEADVAAERTHTISDVRNYISRRRPKSKTARRPRSG